MAILGSAARINAVRVNAFRLGAGGHLVEWYVNSVRVTPYVRRTDGEIMEYANETPNTCVLVVRKTTPIEGQEIKVTQGGSVIFRGPASRVQQISTLAGTRQRWRVEAVDWTRLLDQRLVYKTYIAQTPNAIISDVLSAYTTGFTTANVEGNLAWLSAISSATWTFTGERVSSVLAKVAAAVGGIYKLRYDKDIYLRATSTLTSPTALTSSNSRYKRLKRERILDGIRNRIFVTGSMTSALLATLGQAATVIPVTNAYTFALPTGIASAQAVLNLPLGVNSLTRPVRISYTGTQRSGTVAAPTTQRVSTCQVGSYSNIGGSLTASAAYQWGFTYVTSTGETAISGALLTGFVPAANNQVSLTITGLYDTVNGGLTHVPPDRSVTAINVYRTVANGSQLLFAFAVTNASNTDWPTSVSDTIADGALGNAPPQTGAICPQGVTSTSSTSGATAGATSITNVLDLTVFEPTGGYAVSGQQVLQYSSVTYTNSGGNHLVGTLNLTVALSATIRANSDLIKPCPVLTGVTATDALTPTSPAPDARFASSGGLTLGTLYNWATTFVTAAGESLPSALSGIYAAAATTSPTSPSIANSGVNSGPTNGATYSIKAGIKGVQGMLSVLSAASANVVSNGTSFNITVTVPLGTLATNVYIFRTKANGSTYFLCSSLINALVSSTTFTAEDRETDASLGAQDSAFWLQKYFLSAVALGPTSVTGRKVYRNTGPGTALKLLTTINDNTTTTYDDSTADGSLGAAAPTTDTANVTGVPAIPPSTTAQVFVQVDDTTAQTALAALEGGTGIHEAPKSGTAPDLTTALVLAQGELAQGKNVEETVTYTTEDQTTQVGAIVSVNIAGIVTTQKIQTQRISWIPGRRYPQRDITASNVYKDLFEYLRDLKGVA